MMLAAAAAGASLPLVYLWAKSHERAILQTGRELTPDEITDAERVGVRHPERVRLSVVAVVPPRLPRFLRKVGGRLALGPSTTAGMALGYGIFLRADRGDSRRLLIHELAHTAQYERLGFRRFLYQYLHECFGAGYPCGQLELEAQKVAQELCE